MSKNVSIFEVMMDNQRLTHNKIKLFRSLHSKKKREDEGLFIVEGEKAVNDFLKGFELVYLICSEKIINQKFEYNKYQDKILLDENGKGIKLISKLTTPSNIIGIFKLPFLKLNSLQLKPDQFYLLLDGIQDPGNLGTIIRTCDWFGIYNIYASKDTVDAFNNKVIQSTMGSLTRVKIYYLDLQSLIEANKNIPLIGTLLDGIPIDKVQVKKPAMILMGNEGKGISESLKNKIDIPVTIPPANLTDHPDSLNVSVATAIVLSNLTKLD